MVLEFFVGNIVIREGFVGGFVFYEHVGINESLLGSGVDDLTIMDIGDVGSALIEIACDMGREKDSAVLFLDEVPEEVEDLLS